MFEAIEDETRHMSKAQFVIKKKWPSLTGKNSNTTPRSDTFTLEESLRGWLHIKLDIDENRRSNRKLVMKNLPIMQLRVTEREDMRKKWKIKFIDLIRI